MTSRRALERHRHSLSEIRNIMNSMKTLAYIETRKVDRFLESQRSVVTSIERAALDLISGYPGVNPGDPGSARVYLVIGTERGFCGSMNQHLAARLDEVAGDATRPAASIVTVGRKLDLLLENDARVVARVQGAGLAEEVGDTLDRIVDSLTRLQRDIGTFTLACLHHGAGDDIIEHRLLPPFDASTPQPMKSAYPPVIHQSATELLLALIDHYVFASLNEILYEALLCENRQRVAHLDGATRRLDDEIAEHDREARDLRREEIIEEIEVILLNATSRSLAPY